MAKLQRETDVANVLSQMSQLVHHPFENDASTTATAADEISHKHGDDSGLNDNLEHTYAQNAELELKESSRIIKNTTKGKKNHKCKICGHVFSKLCNLKSHLRVHNGERPHACSLCPRAFANFWDLIRHNRTHSGEKPYKCTHCERCFADFGSHKRHLRLHTKENPYKCHFCSKDFSRMDSYKNHLHTHSDKKPYTCTSCDKKFAYQSTYKRHLKSHSGEKRFACDLCKKRFARQDYLLNHKRIHNKRVSESIDSVININEGELLLCPSTDIENTSSYAVNADLSPIPVLLSMAESAVVNDTMCDTSGFLDSSALLAAASEIELGTSAESSASHYDVNISLETCSDIEQSDYKNDANNSNVLSNINKQGNIHSGHSHVLRNMNEAKDDNISDSGYRTDKNIKHLHLYRHDSSLLYRIGLQESRIDEHATINESQCNDMENRATVSLTGKRNDGAIGCHIEDNNELVKGKSSSVNTNLTRHFESQSFGSCISISDTNCSYSFTF